MVFVWFLPQVARLGRMDVVGTIPWNPGGFDHVRKTNPGDFGGPCGPNSRGVSGWHCLLIRIGQGHPRATWMIRGFVHIPAPHLPHDCSFQATDFSPGVPSLLPWPYLVSTSSFPPKQAGSSQPRGFHQMGVFFVLVRPLGSTSGQSKTATIGLGVGRHPSSLPSPPLLQPLLAGTSDVPGKNPSGCQVFSLFQNHWTLLAFYKSKILSILRSSLVYGNLSIG